MSIKCMKCGGTKHVKNGMVFGRQRYKCATCGYQFTKETPAGKPIYVKLICHGLFMSGLSMRDIAKIVGVTAQSVSRWIKKWHSAYMTELGKYQKIKEMSQKELIDALNPGDKIKLLVISSTLPSGARYHVVIQPPAAAKSLHK